jgi:membrane protein implicated in regulation of membrane protease activity
VVLSLVFLVAMLAVSIATQVVVPILLTVLSIFFARRALRSAVDTVRDAGHRAVDAMDRVRRGGVGEGPEEDARLRVEDEAAPRARVGNVDEPREPEEEDEMDSRQDRKRGR